LEIPSNDHGHGSRIYPLSRTVRIAPRGRVKVNLYQPYINIAGGYITVIIDGRERSSLNPLPLLRSDLTGYHNEVGILISKAVLPRTPAKHPGYSYILSNIPVEEWSDNWLAFSRYPMVIVTGSDVDRMSAGTRTALVSYAECGGILVLDEDRSDINSWRKLKSKMNEWDLYSAGFGKIITAQKNFSNVSPGGWGRIHRLTNPENAALRSDVRLSNVNAGFPVVAKSNISPVVIFAIMLLFSILIGPLNIYILARKKKKIWLLWTVPAGALIFTLVLMGYALLSETWGGYTRSRTLTVLDENTRRATSLGRLAYYYPIPPWSGLSFSPHTEITSIGGRETGRVYSIDWTDGQHLKSGWLIAKTPCQLLLRKNESRRERLEISRHNGKLTLTNGLGAHIERLALWDFDNKFYTASEIRPGAKIELRENKAAASGAKQGRLSLSFGEAQLMPPADFKLMPGSYCARLRHNPFVEPGRKASNHKDEANLVGIMRRETAK
jgi:hypothetical protein